MGFNSAFKGLKIKQATDEEEIKIRKFLQESS